MLTDLSLFFWLPFPPPDSFYSVNPSLTLEANEVRWHPTQEQHLLALTHPTLLFASTAFPIFLPFTIQRTSYHFPSFHELLFYSLACFARVIFSVLYYSPRFRPFHASPRLESLK